MNPKTCDKFVVPHSQSRRTHQAAKTPASTDTRRQLRAGGVGKPKRRIEGEGIGKRLADWLEEKTGSDNGRVRIASLIQSISKMTTLVQELRRQAIGAEVSRVLELRDELTAMQREKLSADLRRELERRQSGWPPSDEAEDLCENINKQLGFYIGGVPELGTFDESGKGIFRFSVRGRSKAKLDEWRALNWMMRLSRKGVLDRIRKCQFCRSYFFATTALQTNCGKKCRRDNYRSSDEWKEKNRQKQREYRELHKNKNVVTRGGK